MKPDADKPKSPGQMAIAKAGPEDDLKSHPISTPRRPSWESRQG